MVTVDQTPHPETRSLARGRDGVRRQDASQFHSTLEKDEANRAQEIAQYAQHHIFVCLPRCLLGSSLDHRYFV